VTDFLQSQAIGGRQFPVTVSDAAGQGGRIETEPGGLPEAGFGLGDLGLGNFGLGNFGLGHFGLGNFGLGHFGLGDFGLGDFGLGDLANWAIWRTSPGRPASPK
jgi:hypothetical protein